MLYAIGRNINKYCRFLNEKLKKFEGKTTEKTAVKTGDNSPIFTYMSLLAVASCAYLLIAHKEYE